jgi:membrane protease YdiL (CAAX protease family)
LLTEIIFRYSSAFAAFLYLVIINSVLFFLSKQDKLDKYSTMMIVLLIVPIVRVVSLFVDLSYIWRIVVVYLVMLFLGYYYSVKFKVDLGEKIEYLWFLPFVIVIGALFGFIGESFVDLKIARIIFVLPLISFAEEIYFRGLLQNVVRENFGFLYSILFPSLLYAFLVTPLGIYLAVFFFISSLLSSIIYHNTRNIFLSIAFNFTISIFLWVL